MIEPERRAVPAKLHVAGPALVEHAPDHVSMRAKQLIDGQPE
jgi:hypothetical protein